MCLHKLYKHTHTHTQSKFRPFLNNRFVIDYNRYLANREKSIMAEYYVLTVNFPSGPSP
jgi:hypothetical protein